MLGLIGARRDRRSAAGTSSVGRSRRSSACSRSTLRSQVEALEKTLGFTGGPRGAPVRGACCCSPTRSAPRRPATAYRSFSGEESDREFSPQGLVVHAGRWYLAAYDHRRDDLRTFRVDRMWRGGARPTARGRTAGRVRRRRHVSRSLAACPGHGRSRCLLYLPVDAARAACSPPTLAEAGAGRAMRRSCAARQTRWSGWPECSPVSAARFTIRPPGRATAPRQRARPATSRSGPAAAAIAASPTRVASITQFISHVSPPSPEKPAPSAASAWSPPTR